MVINQSSKGVINDNFKRQINYLRISVTDRCNLRCIYCVSNSSFKMLDHKDILQYEEIIKFVKIISKMGIYKIRITGGEPLLRKGLIEFICLLKEIKEIKEISLTTNGVLLVENVKDIKDAGINRLNISIDTLDRQKYKKITGKDYWNKVWEGINIAKKIGISPIKLNVVLMKGINDDELDSFAKLSIDEEYAVRFIEYMPFGQQKNKFSDFYFPLNKAKKQLEKYGKLIPVSSDKGDGPADRYKWDKGLGEIGLIHPISRHFCKTCNRLRLTADGKLRPCLLSDYEQDIKSLLRNNYNEKIIQDIIIETVKQKQYKHGNVFKLQNIITQMSDIGG